MAKVALVISSLAAGGAERVMTALAEHLAGSHEVTLITLAPTGEEFYQTDPRVARVGLDLLGSSPSLWHAAVRLGRTVRALRNALTEAAPNVVVSFMDRTNVVTLLAAARRWPVVVSERIDPRHYRPGRLWAMLRYVTYPFAARVVVQTERVRDWVRRFVPNGRIAVIPNPVTVSQMKGSSGPRRRVVAMMGRFEPQKRFDLGVEAFRRASQSSDGWNLLLIGDGPLRPAIRAQVEALGMSGRVTDVGRLRDPGSVLRESAIFLLTSDFEGFPNALLEAMAHGCAVIATDCPSGPSEIVRQGVDGMLVPVGNAQIIGEVLGRLMNDAPARERLGQRALEVADRFAPARIMPLWDQCLLDAQREKLGGSR